MSSALKHKVAVRRRGRGEKGRPGVILDPHRRHFCGKSRSFFLFFYTCTKVSKEILYIYFLRRPGPALCDVIIYAQHARKCCPSRISLNNFFYFLNIFWATGSKGHGFRWLGSAEFQYKPIAKRRREGGFRICPARLVRDSSDESDASMSGGGGQLDDNNSNNNRMVLLLAEGCRPTGWRPWWAESTWPWSPGWTGPSSTCPALV